MADVRVVLSILDNSIFLRRWRSRYLIILNQKTGSVAQRCLNTFAEQTKRGFLGIVISTIETIL